MTDGGQRHGRGVLPRCADVEHASELPRRCVDDGRGVAHPLMQARYVVLRRENGRRFDQARRQSNCVGADAVLIPVR